jgi:hypothetical protein
MIENAYLASAVLIAVHRGMVEDRLPNFGEVSWRITTNQYFEKAKIDRSDWMYTRTQTLVPLH